MWNHVGRVRKPETSPQTKYLHRAHDWLVDRGSQGPSGNRPMTRHCEITYPVQDVPGKHKTIPSLGGMFIWKDGTILSPGRWRRGGGRIENSTSPILLYRHKEFFSVKKSSKRRNVSTVWPSNAAGRGKLVRATGSRSAANHRSAEGVPPATPAWKWTRESCVAEQWWREWRSDLDTM